MIVRWLIVAPLAVVLGLAAATVCQRHIDASRERTFDEELLYLPNEKLLTHFTGGLDSVVADLLWLQCIQYTVEEFHKGRKPEWLAHMTRVITQLDPHFLGAYQYGGTLLAAVQAEDASLDLLGKGMRHRPTAWELPFEAAKVYILNRRDDPNSPAMAAYFLTLSAARDTNPDPDYFINWAERLKVRHNLIEAGVAIWENVYRTTNEPFMRELAARKLEEFRIRATVEDLERAAELFTGQFGRAPQSIQDMQERGIITGSGEPVDALGGRYFIDAGGHVRNTTLLDNEVDQITTRVRTWIDRFHAERGRWPESLDELLAQPYSRGLPPHPYLDREWVYNAATGKFGDQRTGAGAGFGVDTRP